jgi:hypothetical protein
MRNCGRLHPVRDAELAQDIGDVKRGGLRADEERLRDLTISTPGREQGEDLLFPDGETEPGER